MKGKLSPRYIGPFEIVQHISEVAYELALSLGLPGFHLVFHISMLKKYHLIGAHVIQRFLVFLDLNLTFEEESVAILDRQIRKLKSKKSLSEGSIEVSSSRGCYLEDQVRHAVWMSQLFNSFDTFFLFTFEDGRVFKCG